MDILTLLEKASKPVNSTGLSRFQMIMSNPLAQFGKPKKPFLGLRLMPERLVTENQFTEEKINYRTIVANDGTRYSPVQIKDGAKVGSFDVKLRTSDKGADFTGKDYDALVNILKRYTGSDVPMQQMIQLIKWVDTELNMPLVVKNEVMVWQCIVDALVKRIGDNGYQEDVKISNPAGHRVAVLGDWADDSYNPLDDIFARNQFLTDKGMIVRQIIAGTPVTSKLQNNAKVKSAVGGYINVTGGGALVGNSSRVTLDSLNSYLAEEQLPPITKYDNTYQDQFGSNFFLKRDAMVFICETDQTETIDRGDDEPITVEETLGYVGVGRVTGEYMPGRKLVVLEKQRKPYGMEGESVQESFPVNQNPEAVAVLTDI